MRRSATDACGFVEQTARRLRIADDRGATAAENAGLLAPDAVEVVAEPVLVIEIDGGHDRGIGVDDVDGIEPPAEADFEQRDVEPGLGEKHQRGERAVFEIGQRDIAARSLDALEDVDQRSVADVLAVDAHALVVAEEMRRGVRADALAVRDAASLRETRPSSPCRWCRRP